MLQSTFIHYKVFNTSITCLKELLKCPGSDVEPLTQNSDKIFKKVWISRKSAGSEIFLGVAQSSGLVLIYWKNGNTTIAED